MLPHVKYVLYFLFSKLQPLIEIPTCHNDSSIFLGNTDCYYGSISTIVMKLRSFITLIFVLGRIGVPVESFVFVHLLIAEPQGAECDCGIRLI